MLLYFSVFFMLFFSTLSGYATQLSPMFSNNMVLQRNKPLHFFGTAAQKNETITVIFNNQTGSAKADTSGNWSIYLNPQQAGGPYTINIFGADSLSLNEVYIGDVWFCSGQSNMGFKLKYAEPGIEKLSENQKKKIKFFSVSRSLAGTKQNDIEKGKWQAYDENSLDQFSAVAYFFGVELVKKYNIPIGLIHASWGGTNIEAWMEGSNFKDVKNLSDTVSKMVSVDLMAQLSAQNKTYKVYQKELDRLDAGTEESWHLKTDFSNWTSINIPQPWHYRTINPTHGIVWVTTTFNLTKKQVNKPLTLHLGRIDNEDITYLNGTEIGSVTQKDLDRTYSLNANDVQVGENRLTIRVKNLSDAGGFRSSPTELFLQVGDKQIMLAGDWKFKLGIENPPAIPYRVNPRFYPSSLYNAMVHPFFQFPVKGIVWYQGESNAGKAEEYTNYFKSMISDWRSNWQDTVLPFLFVQIANYSNYRNSAPALRAAQAKALSLSTTGMAVSIDIGNDFDVHPKNKKEIGRRLAINAFNIAYGDTTYTNKGPEIESIHKHKKGLLLTFNSNLKFTKKTQINGFEVTDKQGIFTKVEAKKFSKTQVLLLIKKQPNVHVIRYLWQDTPGEVMLYNTNGQPVPPFSIKN